MTGRVVEIRLKSPMPQFLQLLAQPEVGLMRGGSGAGPMIANVDGNSALLDVLPPERRGAPTGDDWMREFRQIRVVNLPAQDATDAFDAGDVDAVLNGHLLSLPLTDRGPLARGTVQLDIVFGLFGLQVNNAEGLLADLQRREALAMAIERATLLEPFGIGSWAPSTRIVPQALPDELAGGGSGPPASGPDAVTERWAALDIEARRQQARARILTWSDPLDGRGRILTLALPDRVGSEIFFAALAEDFAEVGVELQRAQPGERADLQLVDRIARYGDPRWFLNQFNCRLRRGGTDGLCAPEADALVAQTLGIANKVEQARLLLEAEEALLAANIYIPIGAPVRWSLIRGGFEGFSDNPWGLHPLFPIAQRPI